jgi:DNA-binding transcriptional LysR family regulator
MNDRFTAMRLFVRVARTESFSAAAEEMGMTQPSASRIVAALEKRIGAALLTRSTRAVRLTAAGADYLARCEDILAAVAEAEHAARGAGEFRGTLRVAASYTFAIRMLMPRLPRFADRHPELRMEFMLGDAPHDLIGESVDVALRIGALSDSSVVARKVGAVHRVLVAAPRYLVRAGTPAEPRELAAHAIIVGPAGRGSEAWSFRKGDRTIAVRVQGRYVVDATEAASAAAVAGLGVLSTGQRSVQAELEAGQLVRLLPDWGMGSSDISVILPAGRAAKPSARAFANFIAEEIREIEARFPWTAT